MKLSFICTPHTDTVHKCFSQHFVDFNAFYLFTQEQQCVPTPTVNIESCLHQEGSVCREHVLSAPGSSRLLPGTPEGCASALLYQLPKS